MLTKSNRQCVFQRPDSGVDNYYQCVFIKFLWFCWICLSSCFFLIFLFFLLLQFPTDAQPERSYNKINFTQPTIDHVLFYCLFRAFSALYLLFPLHPKFRLSIFVIVFNVLFNLDMNIVSFFFLQKIKCMWKDMQQQWLKILCPLVFESLSGISSSMHTMNAQNIQT